MLQRDSEEEAAVGGHARAHPAAAVRRAALRESRRGAEQERFDRQGAPDGVGARVCPLLH